MFDSTQFIHFCRWHQKTSPFAPIIFFLCTQIANHWEFSICLLTYLSQIICTNCGRHWGLAYVARNLVILNYYLSLSLCFSISLRTLWNFYTPMCQQASARQVSAQYKFKVSLPPFISVRYWPFWSTFEFDHRSWYTKIVFVWSFHWLARDAMSIKVSHECFFYDFFYSVCVELFHDFIDCCTKTLTGFSFNSTCSPQLEMCEFRSHRIS